MYRSIEIYTGKRYYTWSKDTYGFYLQMVKTIFYNDHEKIKFISSSHSVIFFLLNK